MTKADDTHYVYQGTEVKLTGRKAKKETESISRRTQQRNIKITEVVEITPADADNGTWKKWVDMTELFVIG